MRRQIFLYLFLFALLLLIFQYMNEKSIFESQEKQITTLRSKTERYNDSILKLNERIRDIDYFTLMGNDNAMSYLESMGYEAEEVENHISDFIYDQNVVGKNNALVPFDGMEGGMKINKLKFLNHKWILADFTDGRYWGEVIFEYAIKENGAIDLTPLSSLIYPSN